MQRYPYFDFSLQHVTLKPVVTAFIRFLLHIELPSCILCIQYRGGAHYRGGVHYRKGIS